MHPVNRENIEPGAGARQKERRVDVQDGALRILYVINSLVTGGAETLLCALAREMAALEGTTVAVAVLYPTMDEAWRLEGSGVEVISLGLSSRSQVWKGARRLRALFREFRPDVVHAHLFPTSLVAALALSGHRPPVGALFTEHGEANNRREHRWFRPVDAWSYRAFQRIVCVSAPTRDRLVEWIPGVAGRTLVFPNAVSLPGPVWSPHGPFEQDLLYVGRIETVKGLDVLLHALRHLRQEGETPTLAVVGYGGMRDAFERLSVDLGLQGQVRFAGKSGDVGRYMRGSRLLVLPSRAEGMPMVMLEGMALGMPVVATAVGGIPELIGGAAEAGALAPPEDPAALAVALRSMLHDPDRRVRCGREGRRRVEAAYSLDRYAKRMRDAYADVYTRAARRGGAP